MFDVETNFINAVPFAQRPNMLPFPTSVPLTEFNDNWVWGGATQIGAMYAFGLGWFLDVNYTYARSENITIVNSMFVHIQNGSASDFGPAVLNTQERFTNQSVMLTLNYQFR